MLGLDLLQEVLTVLVWIAQQRIGPGPKPLVMRIFVPRKFAEHHKIGLVFDLAGHDTARVVLLPLGGAVIRVVACGHDAVQQRLDALAERVKTDIVQLRGTMRLVLVHAVIGRCAGVLVFGVAGQGAHPTAARPVDNRVGARDE